MEELRSTEILDKEIQNDARKKADQILASCDAEIKRISGDVDTRLESSRKEKQEYYDRKVETFEKNVAASAPLENQRFLVSYIGSSVDEAINAYLKQLGPDKRLDLVLSLFKNYEAVTSGQSFNAKVFGFDENSAKAALEKILKGRILSMKAITAYESGETFTPLVEVREGILLETEDGTIKCRLTLEQLISKAKDRNYGELCETLFCGRLPE